MVSELFYKHCRGHLWSTVKGHSTAVEYFMDAAEECKKTEVIAIIFKKLRNIMYEAFMSINPAYALGIFSAHFLYLKYSI